MQEQKVNMLTLKQSQLLSFLIKNIENSGTSPSYEEICVHLNLKSKSGIHRIVQEIGRASCRERV